jgi:sugar phosphate isomerase/epimerase
VLKNKIARRSFLKSATTATVGCIATSTFPGWVTSLHADKGLTENKMSAIRIGALDSVISGKDDLSWEQVYYRTGELGIEGVELGVGEDYDQTELWDFEGRQRLLGFSKATGVLTPSICLHSYWTYSFASEDDATRKRAGKLAKEAAVAAKEMGAKNILIPFTNPDSVDDELARERWVAGVKNAASAAEDAGVVFCLENVGTSFADKPEDIITIVDAIDSPAVKVYYDPGNAIRSENDPLQAIALLNKRIGQMHVKEVRGDYLGDGIVPWSKIIRAIHDIDYKGWLILETKSTDDPKSAAQRNLETIRGLL